MTDTDLTPVRLTRQRALALLTVFDIGARDVGEAIANASKFVDNADEAKALRIREQQLAAAITAAQIVRARYAGGEQPDPDPTLY